MPGRLSASVCLLLIGLGCGTVEERALESGKDDRAGVANLQEPDGSEPNPGTYAFPLTPRDEARIHVARGWGIIKHGDFYYYCIEHGKDLRWFHQSRYVAVEPIGTCEIDGKPKMVFEIRFRL